MGEVVKKKQLMPSEVHEKFTRVSLAAPKNVYSMVCCVRRLNQNDLLLGAVEFGKLIKAFPGVDASIVAIQVHFRYLKCIVEESKRRYIVAICTQ